MRSCRGFTLTELMVTLAVIGSTSAMTVAIGSSIRSEQRQAQAVARDTNAAAKALRLAAEDVRAGRFGDLNWALTKDVLKRGDEVIARGVRDWTVKPDGVSTRISITLDRQNVDPGTTGTTTATEVVRARTRESP